MFNSIVEAQRELGDTLSSIQTLQDGFAKFPENEALIYQLINFYIETGKAEDAIVQIDKVIETSTNKASLYVAKGKMLEKLSRPDEAIACYKKSIELDQYLFTPYYNISVIYFNRGVDVYNSLIDIPQTQNDKYEAELARADEAFQKSLPFLEKAYQLNDNEVAILESLRTIYYRLGETDKYNEMNNKIKNY